MVSHPLQYVSISQICTVSPSLAETIRNCPLRAGLSRIRALDDFVMGNPRAWLGTAYHAVLENLWLNHPQLSDSELINFLWESAIARIRDRVSKHPLDRRFDAPERWPGFNLARAFVQVHAEQALIEKPRFATLTSETTKFEMPYQEQMSAMNGKLTGRPDLVVGDEIRDYKSGQIFDLNNDGQQTVKQVYVNQLLLYGHLVHEITGKCPSRGKLIPMHGQEFTVNLDPLSCAAAAAEAVELLDNYNLKVASAKDISELAAPCPKTCSWCQYKPICPAFWKHVQEDWKEEMTSAAVCGTLVAPPQKIHNGKAFTIVLSVVAGSVPKGEISIAPLDCAIHSEIEAYQIGEEVRVVNLLKKRNGRLSPSDTTYCVRSSDCPSLVLTQML